jgi:plasmid stabilization system protein ParE
MQRVETFEQSEHDKELLRLLAKGEREIEIGEDYDLETVLRKLEEFPESGRIIPEFPDLPYREVIISPYRFFYRIKDNVIWIVAVWHRA